MTDILNIREKIESLDNQIHDLLVQRAGLVEQISEYKKAQGLKPCVISREAVLMRQILARSAGPLNKKSLYLLWREMIGAMTLLQKEIKIATCLTQSEPSQDCFENARDFFGGAVEISVFKGEKAALNNVREDIADFAVLPEPDDQSSTEDQPWWSLIQHDFLNAPDRKSVQIVARLPFFAEKNTSVRQNRAGSLVAGYYEFTSSGEDNSFLFFRVSSSISRGKLIDLAKDKGLETLGLVSWQPSDTPETTEHLMEVGGFMDDQNPEITDMFKALKDKKAVLRVAGGYPVPIQV